MNSFWMIVYEDGKKVFIEKWDGESLEDAMRAYQINPRSVRRAWMILRKS